MNKNYKTYDEYIKYLCDLKGITLIELCETLNLNSDSVISTIRRNYLSIDKMRDVLNYLDGDANILINLPLKNRRIRSKKATQKGGN